MKRMIPAMPSLVDAGESLYIHAQAIRRTVKRKKLDQFDAHSVVLHAAFVERHLGEILQGVFGKLK